MKLPQGYIALDIETTGQKLSSDQCFAIGWAYSDTNKNITSGNCCLNLSKPEEETWGDFWLKKNYEMKCYNEFWSKNEEMLELLQDSKRVNLVNSEKEMILNLQKALEEVESKFDNVKLITDTTSFDTVWLTILLQKYGYPGCAYYRNDQYRSCYELDSYQKGVYLVHPTDKTTPWNNDKTFQSYLTAKHDHHPENDAKHILETWFATLNAQKRKLKEKEILLEEKSSE